MIDTRTVNVNVSYRLNVPATWTESGRISVLHSSTPPLRYVFARPGGLPRFEYCQEPEILSAMSEITEDTTMTTATCPDALNIKGEHFPCQVDSPHPGLAHSNRDAEAIWSNDTAPHRCTEANGCTDDDCGLFIEAEG